MRSGRRRRWRYSLAKLLLLQPADAAALTAQGVQPSELYRFAPRGRQGRDNGARRCDFVRIRLYRERASEFELLAETEVSTDVRLRFHRRVSDGVD
jgi:hypothetical protein